jgi:hypothetical protein
MKNTPGRVAPPQLFLSQQHRNCGCPIHDAASSRHGWDRTTAHTTSVAAILTSQNGDGWKISPSGCWRRIISRTSAPYPISGKIHLKTMEGLFEQVLKIALEARALKPGRVALDGAKINVNASKYKAMSYDRMTRKERISVRRSKISWRRRKRRMPRRMRRLLSPTPATDRRAGE